MTWRFGFLLVRSFKILLLVLSFSLQVVADEATVTPSGALVALTEQQQLLFLPLEPVVVSAETDGAVFNVFVRDASFGQVNVNFAPTLRWQLSTAQEAEVAQWKQLGAKTFAPWPSVTATPFLYYTNAEGNLQVQKLPDIGVTIGANIVIDAAIENVELADLRNILSGMTQTGLVFVYSVNLPSTTVDEVDPDWTAALSGAIRDMDSILVGGAADTVYRALATDFYSRYQVPPAVLRARIERIFRAVPVVAKTTQSGIVMVHDLSVEVDIDVSAEPPPSSVFRDQYQGALQFIDLCGQGASVFSSVNGVSSVGCSELGVN